jgi:hypothetical protein
VVPQPQVVAPVLKSTPDRAANGYPSRAQYVKQLNVLVVLVETNMGPGLMLL